MFPEHSSGELVVPVDPADPEVLVVLVDREVLAVQVVREELVALEDLVE
jgi:hypothetical protein